mgnify:CR=1 FL=1
MTLSDIEVLFNVNIEQKNIRPTVVPGQVLELRGCFSLSLSISKDRDESERDVFVKCFVQMLAE